jgi:hypothetical protein
MMYDVHEHVMFWGSGCNQSITLGYKGHMKMRLGLLNNGAGGIKHSKREMGADGDRYILRWLKRVAEGAGGVAKIVIYGIAPLLLLLVLLLLLCRSSLISSPCNEC